MEIVQAIISFSLPIVSKVMFDWFVQCPASRTSASFTTKTSSSIYKKQTDMRNRLSMTDITRSTVYTRSTSVAPKFTPGFKWVSFYSIFSFMRIFCRSLFVLLYLFFWPLFCLFVFDIRILIWYLEPLLNESWLDIYTRSMQCKELLHYR